MKKIAAVLFIAIMSLLATPVNADAFQRNQKARITEDVILGPNDAADFVFSFDFTKLTDMPVVAMKVDLKWAKPDSMYYIGCGVSPVFAQNGFFIVVNDSRLADGLVTKAVAGARSIPVTADSALVFANMNFINRTKPLDTWIEARVQFNEDTTVHVRRYNVKYDPSLGISVEDETPKSVEFLRVYPMPATDYVNVEWVPADRHKVHLSLYDALGRRVYHAEMRGSMNERWDIGDLGNGIYFVTVEGVDFKIVHPFTVMR